MLPTSGMHLYEHEGSVYLNVTNRCPVSCAFCVKTDWEYEFRGQDLGLGGREPSIPELRASVEERLARPPRPREAVFCGFGEPTMRLDALREVGAWIRAQPGSPPVRLNTVGLGSMIHRRDIVPELKTCVDAVSVSLNTADPAQWVELHRPAPAWREGGCAAVKDFAARCVKAGLRTRVTAVEGTGADLAAVRAFAESIGAEHMVRPALARP